MEQEAELTEKQFFDQIKSKTPKIKTSLELFGFELVA